jgi:catechol 2,3-dioxygenase-like lactoylglutathione lyase family enzyme
MSHDESRPIGRREMLGLLGVGVCAMPKTGVAADQMPRSTGVDHVEFWVSDPQKSVAFYTRIFGNTVLKNNKTERRYVQIGPAFLAMDRPQAQQPLRVDHVCAGFEGFQIASIHSYLGQRAIAYKDYPSGKDLYVTDPDGTRLQLGADNSWAQLVSGTASAEPIPSTADPIFHPAGIDHILLNVADPEKSAAFYEKILGPVTQRNNNRTWFQVGKSRIGLLQTPLGQQAGVNHFCVSAAAFDYADVTKKLEQAGAKLEKPEVAGAPEFRDPDGYLVQVMARS